MILNKSIALENLNNYYNKFKDKTPCFKSKYTNYCFENILDDNALDVYFTTERIKFFGGTSFLEDILEYGRNDAVNLYYADRFNYYDYTIYIFYQDENNILILNEFTLKDFDFNILIDKTDFKAYLSFSIMLDEDKNIIGKVL